MKDIFGIDIVFFNLWVLNNHRIPSGMRHGGGRWHSHRSDGGLCSLHSAGGMPEKM